MSDKTKLSLIMGARNGAKEEREKDDFYATDPKALELFLDKFAEDGECLCRDIWEPACGDGHLSNVLSKRLYKVYSTDIKERNFTCQISDFLKDHLNWYGDILTNPPYKLAKDFVLHALDIVHTGHKVVMFMKVQFLEGERRLRDIYSKYPPKYVYVHSSRQNCAKEGKFENYQAATLCYCWFVWQKGFKGETILRWIP